MIKHSHYQIQKYSKLYFDTKNKTKFKCSFILKRVKINFKLKEQLYTHNTFGLFLFVSYNLLLNWYPTSICNISKEGRLCSPDSWNLITMVNEFNSFHLCNNILNYIQQETYSKELFYEFPILNRKYKVLQRTDLKNS